METLSPDMITQIYSSTSLGVSIMLAAAGLGSALGWGLICMKYIEGIARQPEMLPALRTQMFITAGLMESFPFIVLAFAGDSTITKDLAIKISSFSKKKARREF